MEEAAERYNFPPRRLRQRLALGAFPGARRVTTDGGADWIIPASSFSSPGYSPVQALPGPPASGGQPPEAEALEAARAQLEAERRIVEADRRQLEADRRDFDREKEALENQRQHTDGQGWLDHLGELEAELAEERKVLEEGLRQLEAERQRLADDRAAPASEAPLAPEETTTPPTGSASMETHGS